MERYRKPSRTNASFLGELGLNDSNEEFPWRACLIRQTECFEWLWIGGQLQICTMLQIYWIISHYCIFMITINGFEIACRCHEQTSVNCCSMISIGIWCAGGALKLWNAWKYQIDRAGQEKCCLDSRAKWHTSWADLHIHSGFINASENWLNFKFQIIIHL